MHIFGPSRAAVVPIKIIKATTAVSWQTAGLVPADRYMTLNLAIKTLTLSSSHRIIALLSFAFVRSRSEKKKFVVDPFLDLKVKCAALQRRRWRVATTRFTLWFITRTIAKSTNTAYLTETRKDAIMRFTELYNAVSIATSRQEILSTRLYTLLPVMNHDRYCVILYHTSVLLQILI